MANFEDITTGLNDGIHHNELERGFLGTMEAEADEAAAAAATLHGVLDETQGMQLGLTREWTLGVDRAYEAVDKIDELVAAVGGVVGHLHEAARRGVSLDEKASQARGPAAATAGHASVVRTVALAARDEAARATVSYTAAVGTDHTVTRTSVAHEIAYGTHDHSLGNEVLQDEDAAVQMRQRVEEVIATIGDETRAIGPIERSVEELYDQIVDMSEKLRALQVALERRRQSAETFDALMAGPVEAAEALAVRFSDYSDVGGSLAGGAGEIIATAESYRNSL